MPQLHLRTIYLIIWIPFCFYCCGFDTQKFVENSIYTTGANRQISIPANEENDTKNKKKSIVQELKENGQLPIEDRIALYYKLKKEKPDAYNFENEDELVLYGYSFLWENNLVEAIAIFKLVVAEFPNSSNAYDSLGEAYLQNGDKELSLVNYEKSILLNPENHNAADQIERIKFPNKVHLKPREMFSRIFSANEYKEDLDQLGATLLRIHPNALKFISKEDFLKSIESQKNKITDSTQFGEFAWLCSEIIANVHCSHTNMSSFGFEGAMLPVSFRFPLQTRLIDGQLFVVNAFNNQSQVKIKDEITHINGLTTATIVSEIFKHIPSQGYIETTKTHFFNTWNAAMIPYAIGFPEKYEIQVRRTEQVIRLNQAVTIEEPFFDRSLDMPDDYLALEFLENDKIAFLTVASFNYYRWNDYNIFEKFIDSSFLEINKHETKNLIIDLRSNPGGSQSSSMHLLRYLVKKPFTYFSNAEFEGKKEKIEGETSVFPYKNRHKGSCYFIIDGVGNSTTGHFMSIVKYMDLGTIIGEELGSNQFCSAGMTTCRLSNTKLEYYVANNTHESLALTLPDEQGILPDYYVKQNIDEYLNNIDVVKNYAIELAKNAAK